MGIRHALVGVLFVGLIGCQSGALLGTLCERTSECSMPLVCRLGRCRIECVTARDCGAGEVCLIDENGAGACEVPSVDACLVSCDMPLICANGHCRDACASSSGCPVGHECSSGACERADLLPDAGALDANPLDANPLDAGPLDAGIDASGPVLACDPIAGTGCPGGRCGLSGGVPACMPTGTPTATLGMRCAIESDCVTGLSCQGARCVRICPLGVERACGNDIACDTGSVEGQDTLPPQNGLGLCSEACDLVADTGCPTTVSACGFGTDRFGHDFTWCRDVGALTSGMPCSVEQDCIAGLGCIEHVCREYCDRTTHLGCSTGTCSTSASDDISTFVSASQVNPCL